MTLFVPIFTTRDIFHNRERGKNLRTAETIGGKRGVKGVAKNFRTVWEKYKAGITKGAGIVSLFF